jgi:hypothetical protein
MGFNEGDLVEMIRRAIDSTLVSDHDKTIPRSRFDSLTPP